MSLDDLTALHSDNRSCASLEPRMAQLETLEAKMASIEVSLSTTAAGRIKRVGKNGALIRNPKELGKELEALRNALRDKENVIQSLKGQLSSPYQRMQNGIMHKNHVGGNGIKPLSDAERRNVDERLQRLEREMDTKRLTTKNLKLALERLDVSDSNIDVRIHQAELEYQLEREELNLLNLEEEVRNLRVCLEESDACRKHAQSNTLFSCVKENETCTLHAVEMTFETDNLPFAVAKKEGQGGLYITWASDEVHLKKGDRLLEVNGRLVISITREELAKLLAESTDANSNSGTLFLTVLRYAPEKSENGEIDALRKELTAVENKLEEERQESRSSSKHHERLIKDSDALRCENIRLTHRISYLEDQISEFTDMSDFSMRSHPVISSSSCSNGSDYHGQHHRVNAVFQKGAHRTTVPAEVAELPCIKSPQHDNRHQYPTIRVAHPSTQLRARLLETLRRVSPPADTRSTRSIESLPSALSEPSRKSKNKPTPPRKPSRLTIQRATSVQSVDAAMDINSRSVLKRPHTSNSGKTHHQHQQQVTLRPWPSMDGPVIHTNGHGSTKVNGHVHLWPTLAAAGLRPSTSLGLTPAKGSEKWC